MWVDLRSLWESSSASLTLTIDAANIDVTGQAATFTIGQALDNGSIGLQGQSASFTIGEAVSAGSITLQGQSTAFTLGLATSEGGLAFQGQDVNLAPTISLAAGAMGIAGQSLTEFFGLAPTNGSISIDGQDVTLSLAGSLSLAIDVAGSIGIQGQDLTLFVQGQLPITGTEVPAGRRIRYRDIYRVTIDGQPFEFRTLAEALRFLERAKSLAQQVAQQRAREATNAKPDRKTPALMPVPQITGSSRELRGAISETKREIAATYRQALIEAEIAMLMELDDRTAHNQEVLWLLM